MSTKVMANSNAGRWDHSEHKYFLELLEAHGKDWKKISSLIPTRTEQQVRSHAQKFYLKLNRRTQKGKAKGKFKLTEQEAFYKKIFDGSVRKQVKQQETQNKSESSENGQNSSISKHEQTVSRDFEQKASQSKQTQNPTFKELVLQQESIIEEKQSIQSKQKYSYFKDPIIPIVHRVQLGWQVTIFPGSTKGYREWKQINKKYFENLKVKQ